MEYRNIARPSWRFGRSDQEIWTAKSGNLKPKSGDLDRGIWRFGSRNLKSFRPHSRGLGGLESSGFCGEFAGDFLEKILEILWRYSGSRWRFSGDFLEISMGRSGKILEIRWRISGDFSPISWIFSWRFPEFLQISPDVFLEILQPVGSSRNVPQFYNLSLVDGISKYRKTVLFAVWIETIAWWHSALCICAFWTVD